MFVLLSTSLCSFCHREKAADLVGRPEAVPQQVKLLRDPDDGVRYWAAVGLHAAGTEAKRARPALTAALKEHKPAVLFLCQVGGRRRALGNGQACWPAVSI